MTSSGAIARALIPAAVITAFALFRKYVPARKPGPIPTPITPGEAAEFSKLQWIVGFAQLAVVLVFAIAAYQSLVFTNLHLAQADGPARFQLLPTKYIWWFFPGFGALCLTWEISLFLWSLRGDKKKIERYAQWSNEKAGFDCTRVLRWMALGIALPVGVATLLALPMHATLRDRDMVIHEYARLSSRHYSYSQARRLMAIDGYRNRDGQFTARAEVIVEFEDGYRWHSEDNRDFTPEVDPALVSFLEQKTGLPLEHAETEAALSQSHS
jgi:hypothetical protein